MDLLIHRAFREIKHTDGDSVIHQGFQPAGVVCVEVRQDDGVRRQSAAPQITADHPVIQTGIQDNHFFLIPKDSRIGIPDAELDIFRFTVREENQ